MKRHIKLLLGEFQENWQNFDGFIKVFVVNYAPHLCEKRVYRKGIVAAG